MEKIKKIGLFSCICIAIGIIVGAGIFGALPVAVDLTGKGIVLAFILATITIVLRYYPTIITGAAIPSSFGYYMHATRLAGPNLGFTQVIATFSNIFVQAILATVFAMYFSALVPVDTRIIAVAVLLIFGAITCVGIKATGAVQNFMVMLLLSAMFTFIIGGLPHINSVNLTLGEIFFPPDQTFLSMGAAIGILSSCLMGGYIVMNFSDEVKNPGKAIPITFVVSTFVTAFIYILLSIVMIGVMPAREATTLAVVADKFMSQGFKLFFITGGALFASLTTINAVFLSGSRSLAVVARDKVIPEWLTRKNRFGVPQNSVLLLTICPAVITAFGVSIGTLLSAFSVLTIMFGIILFIPVIRLPRRYPNSYKSSYMKLPRGMIWIFVVLGTIVSVYQIYSLIATMDVPTWIALVSWMVIWYAYFFIRKDYLKKRGVHLTAIMSAPYQPWEENESSLKENSKYGSLE
ncbi:MAG: APC family permease [Candidatus Aminicenantes bacterium]|nr:APC family permease [Candidatus Aminicenantes bacterium]